jgi:serine/threonine-protein kinase RsbW
LSLDGPATMTTTSWAETSCGRDGLAPLRAFVRSAAADARASDEESADLVQAVDELVCNVLEHGYRGESGPVEVEVESDDGEIAITIRDQAPPFDPASVPAPNLGLPLEQRPLGGMGVHLARTLTDGLDHRILPGGGNETIIRKHLAGATTGGPSDGHHD